ncbi:AAA family ATPase [Inquilinus limosus]|uniref:adenylate/guanylate cyclase domain-containing protein n=1 Tax=Inquilinus limosus TaxID=171674 RepID=UPI003F14B051
MARELKSWLEDLGLGLYAEAFAENGVDFDLLPELTNEDLKDLGIIRLADRKRLLKAIADIAPAESSVRSVATAMPAAPGDQAERRQLTVMFCDLVGSTALSGSLDPEELREILRAYQAACASVIERYDGHVAKYIGDGLLAYFGIPRAHEDDAQRAVSAGLGIVEAVRHLSERLEREMGIELGVRLGVHTGLVVAGAMGFGAAREEMAIVGETPNIAARLQALASPNALVISPSTKQLVAGLFSYEDLGVHQLRGVARPMQIWRVIGERPTESRFEALHATGLVPLVGRDAEIDLLMRRWEQAKQGKGQVVLLCGEPGIGKSRLPEALRECIAEDPHVRLRCQCSAHFTNSALYPFVRQLEQAAGLLRTDPPEAKLDKLERVLAESGQAVPEVASLFAALLSIPVGGRYPALDLTPQRLKEKTLAALVDRLLGLAARQPVLFVVEDAHWIDPSSDELISASIDRLQDARVLMVVTCRPDYTPSWSRRTHVTVLMLNRLSRTQAATMVGKLTAATTLPPETIDQIVAKADGVPLFVEELTKAVLESGFSAVRAGGLVRDGPPQLSVPATLQDTLMARLDRTAATKEVAQTASVLGREFSEALLAEVSSLDGEILTRALDELVQAGLIFRRGSPPQTHYVFKHALVQDAAYETLLVSVRQQLHARTAEALEQEFAEITEEQPELLAHHYEAAGLWERAIAYWQRAGARASERSNYVEAEHHLTRAVALMPELPDDRRKHAELGLQMSLGAVYRAIRGSGSSQTEGAYRRARVLCEQVGDADRLLEVVYGQFICAFNRPKLHDAEGYATEFLEIAQRGRNASALTVAYQLIGGTAFLLGDLVRSRRFLEECLRVDGGDRTLVDLYSHRQYPTFALTYLAWALFALGYPEQAHARAGEAIAASEGMPAFLYAMALGNGCYLHHFCGDCAAVEANVEALLGLAAEKGIVVFHEVARVFQGWTRARRGAVDDGIELMRDALAKLAATEQKVEQPYTISILAETYLRAGRWPEAQEQLDEALRLVQATDECWYEAELHRLAGEVALAQGDMVSAEAQFDRALTVARAQSARMWELRAAKRLARLRREAGKITEARALLAPVIDAFTEGFETADLLDGKALLNELA